MKNHDQCCSHDCSQGRACPRRTERRTQASLLRRLFGWIISERRKTLDPRARVDMGGLPDVVFMSGASSMAETEANNRRWLALNAPGELARTLAYVIDYLVANDHMRWRGFDADDEEAFSSDNAEFQAILELVQHALEYRAAAPSSTDGTTTSEASNG